MNLGEAARLLGGVVMSGDHVLCPGPGHSRTDRSLSVRFDPNVPGGFIVNSFAGDSPLKCRDHVRQCLGMPAFGSSSSSASTARTPRPKAPAPAEPPKPDPRAMAIWDYATAIEDTLGEEYLRRHRGITLDALPVTLRFGEVVKHPTLGIYLPAIVCALAEVPGPIIAVQCVFLNARRATKASISAPKITIGRMSGGAVQLGWPDTRHPTCTDECPLSGVKRT
jgi:hypothetical protein